MSGHVRVDVRVEGVVQGVGFRPFVYSLATALGLAGRVGNDVEGVFVEVEGPKPQVDEFLRALERDAPPLAGIERVSVVAGRPGSAGGFTIVDSDASGHRRALVSPDGATCSDCLRELADPADRRFRYPFINCTNCGPRFTIVRDVPYDRPLTTMAGFTMCAACAAEYHDPADRRFHAQPTCCPACGPQLRLLEAGGSEPPGDPTGLGAAVLRAGEVLAVKGLGGYHLAVLAGDEAAVSALRRRKHREDKPFAVMVPDLGRAALLCELDGTAAALLTGRGRPIVLLPRAGDAPVAESVAPGNRRIGLMLPYTPLHHLLLAAVGEPIVLTSGNVSDEPIAYVDSDAFTRLAGIAAAFLTHDRPIHIRTDDSVVRPFLGRESVLRRSRGYVPEPVTLRWEAPRPILACGAELKNTFCLAKEHRAFVSHHIGDLENYETLRSFAEGIDHFARLFGIEPELVAHDLHPEYLSTKHARDMTAAEPVGVQHHHAHIASCLADNGEPGPVIGVAFDGLGYGTDGTIWGGEFLLADLVSFERIGHLAPVPMPGGAAAIRQPWRMAAAYLDEAYDRRPPERLEVARRNHTRWEDVVSIGRAGLGSPLTSSAGRLFDAVSAVLGTRDTITYEGQAAIELEQLADPAERGAYVATVSGGGPLVVSGADLVRAAAEDLLAGVAPALIAARFHNGVAEVIVRCCRAFRDSTGVTAVALSGGVFQNVLLLERAVDRLRAGGFRVLTHFRVPANDGGISLGQAAVAAARDRAGVLTGAG
ncbi:carbamoyltransferase HypF [Sphaerisporangium flaviroseum]|uniref:Carbamoyltransferase n=1 Tax=Sphaerisporangium flaviroseum TaxID=509199 RepID=A0ABP7IHN0_9ACTN